MSWPLVKLKDISTHIDYGLTASAEKDCDGPLFLRITDLGDNGVIWGNVPRCLCDDKKKASNLLHKGDIVFARTGATTGKSYLIRDLEEDTVFASYLIRVKPSDKVYSPYLAYFFKSPSYWHQISGMSTGATLPGVNASKLSQLEIPLPPLAEQKRIAAILDKADAIRQKRKQVIDLADEFLRSVFLDMFGDPVTNPKGWEEKALWELTSKPITYGILKPEEHEPLGVPMLRIQDIKNSRVQLDDLHHVSNQLSEQYKRTILEGNELVMSLVGTIGLVARVPEQLKGANVHRNLGVIDITNKNQLDYLLFLMQMNEFKVILSKVTKGGVHKLLNLSDLKEVVIPIPNDSALEKFNKVFAKNLSVKEYHHSQCLNEDMLFKALSQKAFSGEL
ncbi:type I restriction enzyme S subunit [Vibrio crassostreae]|uniref:restriction endonuclease subunit S n=1 Tax=Vibrio crassostreae TaxID=246167 RepID=UPI000F46C744|nr:restriction endonuclease subunit S [Vibrio crassostreae]ROR70205.1 type I restriction enzyme S subunit [Vibrio crassostreae]